MSGTAQQIVYSYAHVPTVKAFAKSDAFIRGLQGPFACLPAETEFLSSTGWKRMDQAVDGDLIAQWDQASNRIEFVEPIKRIVAPCEDMIRFSSPGRGGVSMVLSDEHRVPHYDWKGEFTVKTAAQIALRPSRRTIPTVFSGPSSGGLEMSDDMIRFAVMMHADGSYPKQGLKAVVVLRKERKKTRLRALMQRLGVAFTESIYARRPTETQFRFVPPYFGKTYGPEWYQANAAQLQVILDEMDHWDGLHGSRNRRFFSARRADIEFMQYAAHACGLRAVVGKGVRQRENHQEGWQLHIRVSDNAKNRACIREGTRIDRVPTSDGRKYCFEVPTSFFVARHDGFVFITGNSGKSAGCVVEIVKRGMAQRPGPDGVARTRWAVIRQTYSELRMTTIKTVLDWFPPAIFGDFRENPTPQYIIRGLKGVEIEILFLALDRPEDVKKLLSLELTGAWVNEAREVPWGIIEVLQGRLGRFPAIRNGGPTWTGLIMDTNPPDADSKWYWFFEEADHSESVAALAAFIPGITVDTYAAIFKQPSGLSAEAENLPNLQPGYYQRLAIGKSPEWVNIYVKGQYGFVMEGLPVFPEFQDSVHMRGDLKTDPSLPVFRGWDFGLTPSCIYSQATAKGQLITVDEITSENMGIMRFAEFVLQHSKTMFKKREFIDVGDPAGMARSQTDERSCFEIMRGMGIDIWPAPQTLQIRLESMRKPLNSMRGGQPGFLLHERCKTLRRAFLGGYHYKKMGKLDGEWQNLPNKNRFSHPMDAQTYIAAYLYADSLTTLPDQRGRNDDEVIFANNSTRDSTTGY